MPEIIQTITTRFCAVRLKDDLIIEKGAVLRINLDDDTLTVLTGEEADKLVPPVVQSKAPVTPVVQSKAPVTPDQELAWEPGQPSPPLSPKPTPKPTPSKSIPRHRILVQIAGEDTPRPVQGLHMDILKRLHASNNRPINARDILNGVGGCSPSARLTEMHGKDYLTRFGNPRGPYSYVASDLGMAIATGTLIVNSVHLMPYEHAPALN
jgi:hypothetical protein